MASPDYRDIDVPQIAWGRDNDWKAHCAQRADEVIKSYEPTRAKQLTDEAATPIQVQAEHRSLLSRLRSWVPNFRDLFIGD